MPRRIGRWMAVLVASSVAMLAPVPVLTPAAEAAEPSAPLQATVDAYVSRAQTVTWEPCEGLLFQPRSSCATVVVPRDWKNPAAGTLRLAVSYLRASGTSKGLLTSNPGGPGAEGLLFTEALSRSKPKLYQDYDLLGFVRLNRRQSGRPQEFIRERLFRPFDSTKSAGMGIGVFESREYIHELGGQLEVRSEPGKGTTFCIVLPPYRQETQLAPRAA